MDYYTSAVEFEILNPETYIRWFAPEFSLKHLWGVVTDRAVIERRDEDYQMFDDWVFYMLFVMTLTFVLISFKLYTKIKKSERI